MTGSEPRQIGLFIPPTLGYFGDVVLGIQEFVQAGSNWVIELCPTLEVANATCSKWVPDAVLVNCTDGDWESFLRRLKVPIVQVGGPALAGLPRISTDNFAIGQMAAEHFLERGIRRFAFCGYDNTDWSAEREEGFRRKLATAGQTCVAFHGQLGEIYAGAVTGVLAKWIRSLERPTAIFACHDRCAMLLANTCAYLKVHVPDEIAILGVDNDLLECGFASPAISSIMGAARRVGFEGAKLLSELLDGKRSDTESYYVPPAGVAVRQSTDVLMTDDPDVRAALRFIHKHAIDPIEVADVLEVVLLSRRSLERKFREALNRTPSEEILRARTAHAKTLLLDTSLSILEISNRCGFPSASKFSTVFTRETGTSPRIFRRHYSTRLSSKPAQAATYPTSR